MQLTQAFFRDIPNIVQLFDYDVRTDGQAVYMGYAPFGSSQADDVWVIFKFTYNADNTVSKVESVGDAIWATRSLYFA